MKRSRLILTGLGTTASAVFGWQLLRRRKSPFAAPRKNDARRDDPMIQVQLKEVGIDYPQPGERIGTGPYTFRLTAPEDAKEVRLSIDDGPWQPCRKEDGRWWFDWSSEAQGDHIAVCRVIEADGSFMVSQPRLFHVETR